VNAGGLQWLDEAAGQADGDDVLVPGLAPPAGLKLERERWSHGVAADRLQQFLFGVIVGDIAAAIHEAVPHAVL
jgi:hypothetical protein